MAKWLDRLKSCFGRKTGEIAYTTATKNISRSVTFTGVGLPTGGQQIISFAPECTIRDEVKTFTPKVGQLMLDKWQILELLLRTHSGHHIFEAGAGWVIWNPKKQKYQTFRSKPMVAINCFLPNADEVSVSLYGADLFVGRDQLQFK